LSSQAEGEQLAGYIVEYDPSTGEVVERFNGTVKEAIEVRKGMLQKAVLYAAITELENLGYTVIAPGSQS
jgi:L-amino acid N-acyltransferase YncA